MTVAAKSIPQPQIRRWTLEEFYKLSDEGWFAGQRVLLLEGEIIQMPPMKHEHALAVSKCRDVLLKIFGAKHWVRDDMPLNLGIDSDPEPDIAVAEHPMSAYKDHPSTALLVVEVSDTTLALDHRKAAVYAAAGIAEYWIVNLNERKLEVFRQPDRDRQEYLERKILNESDSLAPVCEPAAKISVVELLP